MGLVAIYLCPAEGALELLGLSFIFEHKNWAFICHIEKRSRD
jgi:hypothetical protein